MFSSSRFHCHPLCKRVGSFLLKLKAISRRGRPKSLSTKFNWLSFSIAAMELPNQLKLVFDLIDINGDGKISPVELSEVLLCLGHKSSTLAQEVEVMIREVDSNGDGFIDLDEFMQVVGGQSERELLGDHEDLIEAFQVFDLDRNGFISAKELRRVLVGLGHGKCSLRECRFMIRGVDKNGDGMVDFEEFKSMMTSSRT